tara:strand:- start:936 stop:1271 length:336 start_codon:yes stop_codon:yes gene_type:complete
MAIYANINVDQGSDFFSVITVEDITGNVVDLTGYSAAGQVRKTYASNTIAATFGASITQPTLGKISLTLPATTTSAMKAGRFVYDVEITSSGGTVSRVIEGQVEVLPGVTR